MTVRLKLEDSSKGLMATISQRNEAGQTMGQPVVFIASNKEEAKTRAKTLARSLGLKTYGIVDKAGPAEAPVSAP